MRSRGERCRLSQDVCVLPQALQRPSRWPTSRAVAMSSGKQPDSDENDRLRELEAKKLQHQIWEHRLRIAVTILGILGAVQVSGLP